MRLRGARLLVLLLASLAFTSCGGGGKGAGGGQASLAAGNGAPAGAASTTTGAQATTTAPGQTGPGKHSAPGGVANAGKGAQSSGSSTGTAQAQPGVGQGGAALTRPGATSGSGGKHAGSGSSGSGQSGRRHGGAGAGSGSGSKHAGSGSGSGQSGRHGGAGSGGGAGGGSANSGAGSASGPSEGATGAPEGSYEVMGLNMEPTYPPHVTVSYNPTRTNPSVGEAVVFHMPLNALERGCGDNPPPQHACQESAPGLSTTLSLGRVVGVGGDALAFSEGSVIRDGQLQHEASTEPCGNGPVCSFSDPIVVPGGYYYVLYDNRAQLDDSRVWGAVPQAAIVGTVTGVR